jgi:hypothetical protein
MARLSILSCSPCLSPLDQRSSVDDGGRLNNSLNSSSIRFHPPRRPSTGEKSASHRRRRAQTLILAVFSLGFIFGGLAKESYCQVRAKASSSSARVFALSQPESNSGATDKTFTTGGLNTLPQRPRLTGSLSQSPLFLPPVATLCPNGPFAVADVNGDGKADIVAAPAYQGMFVCLGNGDGTFQSPINTPIYINVASLTMADLNGDGKPDLVLASPYIYSINSTGVNVLLGNGDGTFQAPQGFATSGTDPGLTAVADLNGDGKPDIVATDYYSGSLSVLLGNGDGTFQAAVAYPSGGASLTVVTIADVNGDGKPDILAGNNCGIYYNCIPDAGATVGVLLGNGDGTFQAAVTYRTGGSGSVLGLALAVADVNNDQKPDILVANAISNSVSVLLGTGDGTLQPAVVYASGGADAKSIAIAHVNSDSALDVVLINGCTTLVGYYNCTGDSLVGLLLGNGDGTLQSALTYDLETESPESTAGIMVADLDGDHKPDLIVGWPGGIAVLINDTGSAPPKTTISSSPRPSIYGQPVVLTAKVSSPLTLPTGSVSFSDGATLLGTGKLNNGIASISVTTLSGGSHSITANYLGSGSLYPSTSAPLRQIVTLATTTITLSSSSNPAPRGKAVNFSVWVSSQWGGLATGFVSFSANSQVLGTASVYDRADFTASFATDGAYNITATYLGDGNNSGSTSLPLLLYVDYFTSRTTVTSSDPVSFVNQPVTFTATVTSARGTIQNGDLVTFTTKGVPLGTAVIANGVATLTTSSLSVGTHIVRATYAGSATVLSSFNRIKQVVNRYPTTVNLTPRANRAPLGFP